MKEKYKLETWKKTKWKGTQRATQSVRQVLVKRDSNGQFAKKSPVIEEIHEKTYGSGVYKVGYRNGKAVSRLKVAQKTPEWYEKRKEVVANRQIFRCSLVLNDIPSTRPSGHNEYYGFRIIAFSHSKILLRSVYPEKMRQRLIRFIEQCFRYKEDDFWFSTGKSFFGHEDISLGNSYRSDDGKYYLQWQKRYGTVMKREQHSIGDL